ncbi:MAG: hypothetical protein MK008_05610 [Bdellovibrionales bacterium]|nr:hypothetical protein [Bdellovibrionales bacterium]
MVRNLLGAAAVVFGFSSLHAQNMDTRFYGYLDGYFESVEDQTSANGAVDENSSEFNVPNLSLVINSNINNDYRAYMNLTGQGAGNISVRNAWVEKSLAGDYLKFRIGKLYRPFGIYNEILDAVPTYIGIEAPELFDTDHLMLTRTTNLMLWGQKNLGVWSLRYVLKTGNDERESSQVPYGIDLQYNIGSNWKFGFSYYDTNGKAKPINDKADSPSEGGVHAWMSEDEYNVMGPYFQYKGSKWTVQAATYQADHNATRDDSGNVGESKADLICQSTTSANQRIKDRFGCVGNDAQNTNADYKIDTYYLRVGYNFDLESGGQITPYAQYDYYKNPEMVYDKSLGGDKEAGVSDDGDFVKWTVGTVYRPNYTVTFKLDYSQHMQDVVNESKDYGEIRFSYSYFWKF